MLFGVSHTVGNGFICEDGWVDGRIDGNQTSGTECPPIRRTGNLPCERRLHRMHSSHSHDDNRMLKTGTARRIPRPPKPIPTLEVQMNDEQKA